MVVIKVEMRVMARVAMSAYNFLPAPHPQASDHPQPTCHHSAAVKAAVVTVWCRLLHHPHYLVCSTSSRNPYPADHNFCCFYPILLVDQITVMCV